MAKLTVQKAQGSKRCGVKLPVTKMQRNAEGDGWEYVDVEMDLSDPDTFRVCGGSKQK